MCVCAGNIFTDTGSIKCGERPATHAYKRVEKKREPLGYKAPYLQQLREKQRGEARA